MLLVGGPELLREMVREALDGHEDIDLVLQNDSAEPARLVGDVDPSTVVWCGPQAPPDETLRTLLYGHPRLRIIAITGEGRTGVLHELVPRASSARDLSPEALLSAIRGGTLETD